MLIGICGGLYQFQPMLDHCTHRQLGICAGKSSVASYLIEEHGFKRVYLARTAETPAIEKSASEAHVVNGDAGSHGADISFEDVETLLDFVTKRWRERWLTTDIWDDNVLEVLLRRPFFLLVSVDAPVTVRWERFKARYE